VNKLAGAPGELRMTIEIKRAKTGKIETYELVGNLDDIELPTEDSSNGKDK